MPDYTCQQISGYIGYYDGTGDYYHAQGDYYYGIRDQWQALYNAQNCGQSFGDDPEAPAPPTFSEDDKSELRKAIEAAERKFWRAWCKKHGLDAKAVPPTNEQPAAE